MSILYTCYSVPLMKFLTDQKGIRYELVACNPNDVVLIILYINKNIITSLSILSIYDNKSMIISFDIVKYKPSKPYLITASFSSS